MNLYFSKSFLYLLTLYLSTCGWGYVSALLIHLLLVSPFGYWNPIERCCSGALGMLCFLFGVLTFWKSLSCNTLFSSSISIFNYWINVAIFSILDSYCYHFHNFLYSCTLSFVSFFSFFCLIISLLIIIILFKKCILVFRWLCFICVPILESGAEINILVMASN